MARKLTTRGMSDNEVEDVLDELKATRKELLKKRNLEQSEAEKRIGRRVTIEQSEEEKTIRKRINSLTAILHSRKKSREAKTNKEIVEQLKSNKRE